MNPHSLYFSLFLLLFVAVCGYAEPVINTTISNTSHSELLLTTDLAISGSITPRTAEMGSPFSADIEVINAGPAPADGIRINYYLVQYNTTGSEPIWIHQKTADKIPAFYKDLVPFTIDIPGGITPGQYSLFATISTTTTDRNLSNNEYLSQLPINVKPSLSGSPSGLPDLSLRLDSISTSEVSPGYPLTINYTVLNSGTGDAGTFHVGFYLSPDPEIKPSDLKLWDEVYYHASPGMVESGVSTDLVPLEIPPGEYYLGAIADFTNMVTESDENNNTAIYGTPVTVLEGHQVDAEFLDKVAGYIAVKTNLYRQYRNLPNLSYDYDLADVAKGHSIDMASRHYFSHISPEGADPTDRADAVKYETTKRLADGTIRTGIAENIVKISGGYTVGFGYSGFVDSSNPEAVADVMMIEWISSPEHNQNLINPGVDRIGVGVAYDGDYFYATQNFY